MIQVSRNYPGVKALDSVDFAVRSGQVHALVGENGAGKSTLINILSGVIRPDSGKILLGGNPTDLADPVAARHLGIITVHQEAELFPTLSVAENMALTQGLPVKSGFVDWLTVNQNAKAAVTAVGADLDVHVAASQLSVAHRHMTQVAIAVQQKAKVVILDEPTSALSELESQWLFEQIAQLKAAGTGIIYISHRHEEIFELADEITVLRDGKNVWSGKKSAIDRAGLIAAMVGRTDSDKALKTKSPPDQRESGLGEKVRLQVNNLADVEGVCRGIDLRVTAGEVVGVYGLIGAGRSEFAQTLFGLKKKCSGHVVIDGTPQSIRSPQEAVRAGLAYLPEDRLRQGLCRGLSVRANAVLSSLARWSGGMATASAVRERSATQDVTRQLSVRLRSVEQAVGQLSGGNQQKVVLGRWLLTEPKVLILDEPTRGVDVGAKSEIHDLLRQLAHQGLSIVLISSELPEVIQHADRILVFRAGMISGEYDPAVTAPAEIAAAALPPLPDSLPDVETDTKSDVVHKRALPKSELGLLTLVVVLMLWLGFTTEGFFEPSSLVKLAHNTSLGVILGLAAATVIIAGGIDISVGSLLALAAVCAGITLKTEIPIGISLPLALAVACCVGALGGLLNGAISLIGRVHPIVVTLGMMSVYRGLVVALRGQHDINDLPQEFTWLAVHPPSGFRGSIIFAVVVATAAYVWLAHTRSGRHLFALGASPSAARLVGISRRKMTLVAFTVGGLLIGIAGIVELARSGSMQSRLATGWELQAIAIAVIGGVSITGGRGSVLGVVLGALLLQLVQTALIRWQIRGDQMDVVIGGMILMAVLFDLFWQRHK